MSALSSKIIHDPKPDGGRALELSERDARRLARLLGHLQDYLEGAIESCLLNGESQPRELHLRPAVAKDRRLWREAEEFVARFTARTSRRAKP